MINSWSWDNTEDYTDRSRMIDEWTYENPGHYVYRLGIMEIRCLSLLMHTTWYRLLQVILKKMVVCGRIIHTDRMSMIGEAFVSAPGMNVVSAKADGSQDSLNNGSFTMTGTSMPHLWRHHLPHYYNR